jgi:hypothetical protein
MDFNIKDIDMYSKNIGFYFYNKDRITSKFGFCLTIAYIFISLGLFLYYTWETIKRTNMIVHDSTMYLKETSDINIDQNLFYFAFGVENPKTSSRFIDESIYYPKVTFFEKIKEGSTLKTIEEKEVEIERCKQEKFGDKYQNLFVKDELNNSYCINDINKSLTKKFSFDRISYIKIEIHACINTTENNNHCKPKEVIDEHISGTFFSLVAKDIGLDPANYSDPIIATLRDLHTTIDKKFFRDFILYFGLTEVQTDEGLLNEKIHKERYMNFIKTTQAFYYRDEEHYYNGETMCEIQIKIGEDIRVHKRTFRKMTEVFAITGGYMQLISTIFKILTLLSNKLGYEIKMVNSLFNIYPKRNKIKLKYRLQNKFDDKKDKLSTKQFSLYRIKNSTLSSNNNKIAIHGIDKHSVNRLNINDYLVNSIKFNNCLNSNSPNPNQYKNSRTSKTITDENVSPIEDNVRESSNNYIGSKNKSKISLLNLGINIFNNNSFYNKNNIGIKNRSIFTETVEEINMKSTNVKMNVFYYYLFSRCKNSKVELNLFNLAISFYKKKLDIIHLFCIILLIEKISNQKCLNE